MENIHDILDSYISEHYPEGISDKSTITESMSDGSMIYTCYIKPIVKPYYIEVKAVVSSCNVDIRES